MLDYNLKPRPVVHLLEREGLSQSLIELGEFRSIGSRPDGQAWQVGLENPVPEDAALATISMNNNALAVSRGQAGFFPDFPKHTHLVNPLTGESPRYFQEIAVSAPTAALADGLSTAASFLPEEKIREMIPHYFGATCYVVENGRARRVAAKG